MISGGRSLPDEIRRSTPQGAMRRVKTTGTQKDLNGTVEAECQINNVEEDDCFKSLATRENSASFWYHTETTLLQLTMHC